MRLRCRLITVDAAGYTTSGTLPIVKLRMLRQDVAPAVGKENALVFVSAIAGTLTWKPTMADVSASGDLGYTYGAFDLKRGDALIEHGSYVRVWKKESGKWRIVIEVMSPDPKD